MHTRIALLVMLALALGGQQTVVYQVPLWNPTLKTYEWYDMGTSLEIRNGKVEAVIPRPPAPIQRIVNYCLTYDAPTTSWGTIPTGAQNVELHLNGFLHLPRDFVITDGRVSPKPPWRPGAGQLVIRFDWPSGEPLPGGCP